MAFFLLLDYQYWIIISIGRHNNKPNPISFLFHNICFIMSIRIQDDWGWGRTPPPRIITAAADVVVGWSCDAGISDTTIQHRIVTIHGPTPHAFALGMADGERSPLLADPGDGALGSGNGGVSPGAAPYGAPKKPPSEYRSGAPPAATRAYPPLTWHPS